MFYKDFISWYIYCLLYLRKDKLGDLWAGYITPGKPYPHEHINILGDYPVSLYLKTSSRKRSTSCLAALVALPLMLTAAQAQPIFNITDLGTLGGNFSHTYDINDHGQVTGISRNASDELRAFIWDQTNGMQDLGTLGGNYSSGRGINNQGQVTGISINASDEFRAFIWDQTNGIEDLGNIPNYMSQSSAINDRGEVTGTASIVGFSERAFLWDQTNGMMDLNNLIDINDPLFGQVRLTGAYGINNNGDIIAIEHDFWNNGGRQTRAFLLTRQQVTNNNPTGVSEPGLLGLMGLGLVGMRLATRRQKAGT